MYLNILSKEEKELFLDLAFRLSYVDNNYSDDEKVMIKQYCHEMNIEFEEKLELKTIDEIINKFKSISSLNIKKIIIFEIIGLAMADGHYCELEIDLVKKLESEFEIESGFYKKCEGVIEEYFLLQDKINKIVIG